jgi:hypothetical protein
MRVGNGRRYRISRAFTTVTNKELLLYYYYTYIPLTLYPQRHLRYSFETPKFYQNYLAINFTADVTGGKPIAV